MKIIHRQVGWDPMYMRWHYMNGMLLYCYRGSGSIVFPDENWPLEDGVLCWLGTGQFHYTMPSDPAIYDRSKLIVENAARRAMLSVLPGNSDFVRLYTQNAAVWSKLEGEARKEAEKAFDAAADAFEHNRPEYGCLQALSLMILLSENVGRTLAIPDASLVGAVHYIHENFGEPLTLDKISGHIHMSKYYFCRRFKAAFGMTAMDYLLKTRLAAARVLLLQSRMSIGRAAQECGFLDASYFAHIFREAEGVTPCQYRQLHLGQQDLGPSKDGEEDGSP